MRQIFLFPMAMFSLLLAGGIFGFFYAWVCSTMWGLDQADPNVAISAMQAMNASVRNGIFAPAFFGTPFVMMLTGAVAYRSGRKVAAASFGAGGIIYLLGGMVLTMAVNVPMNQALALVETPMELTRASEVWNAYSGPWQTWNITRTVASGVALLLAGVGLWSLQGAPVTR